MQQNEETTLGPKPSDPLTTHMDQLDGANDNLEDLNGDQTESILSNPPPSFFTQNKAKIKKISIISIIIIIVTLIIVLPIVLTLKNDDNPPNSNPSLLFERSFKIGDTFHYFKTGAVCATPSTTVDDPVPFCQGIKSNFSFHVTNVQNSKAVIPQETMNYKIVSVILHLKELVYENGTDSIPVGGATFTIVNTTNVTRRFLSDRDNSTSNVTNNATINNSNLSNTLPIIKAELFDNGTIYRVFKPKNISDQEWSHMKDLLSEFSPVLAKRVYINNDQNSIILDDSTSNSSTTNNANNQSNNNSSNNNNNKGYQYSESYGSSYIQPSFNYTSQSHSMVVSKTIGKSSFMDIQLPNNSLFSANHTSLLNKSTGFLDSSIVTSSSTFQRSSVPPLQPEDDIDYFTPKDMRIPRYETNFTDHNYYQNTGTGMIQTNSTTNMNLYQYVPEDKNTTLILESLANQTEFEEVPRQEYIRNDTKIQEMRMWELRLQKHLDENGFIKKPQERLLFDSQSIEELRNNLGEIVYPVYQIDFHGWRAKLLLILDLRPYDNTMNFDIRLTIDGVFDATLVSKSYPCQMSDSIDKIIAFLYKAYGSIQDIANKFGDALKFDFGGQIQKLFESVNNIVSMPFDIEKIFSQTFANLGSDLQSDIDKFLSDASSLIQNNLIIITNPLTNYTNDFNNQLRTDVTLFLKDSDQFVSDFQSELKSAFDNLYNLSANTTHIFPDLIEDVRSLEQLISNGFSSVPNLMTILLQNDYSGHLNDIVNALKSSMSDKYKTLLDNLKNSGYSNGLLENIQGVEDKIQGSFREVDDWMRNMLNNFDNGLKTDASELFNEINTTSLKMVSSLNNQLENLADFLQDKTLQFLELRKYETAFNTFQQIHEYFIDFRYKNFSKLFELPLINDDVMGKSMVYIDNFYNNFTKVESFTLDFFNNLKKNIDSSLYASIQNLRKFNGLINIGLLDENVGFISQNIEKYLKEISQNYTDFVKETYNEIVDGFLSIITQKLVDLSQSGFVSNNNNKIVLCSEERTNLLALLDAFDSIVTQLITDTMNYYKNQTLDIQNRLIQSLSLDQVQTLAQSLLIQNNLTNPSIFYDFETPINSSMTASSISILISLALNVTQVDFSTMLAQQLAQQKNDVSQLINNTFDILGNYSESELCETKNLTSTIPMTVSFCVIYDLTARQLNTSDPTVKLVAPCLYEDELVPYMNNVIKKLSLFSPIKLTKLQILTNSRILSHQETVSEIMSTLNQSIQYINGLQSPAIYTSLDEILYNVQEVEIKTMNDFLFNSLDEVIANFSNSINNSTDQLLQFFRQNLQDLTNLINNNFNSSYRLPNFLNENILQNYNNLKNQAQELMDRLKNDSSSKFSFLLEQMALLHVSNNRIALNYLNDMADNMVPYAVLPQVRNSLNGLDVQLANFYGNTTQLRNALVTKINNILFVNYQKFNDNYNIILQNLGSISSQATNLIEDLSLNASSGFEYNSYEKLKDLKEVYNTANSDLPGLSMELLNGNLEIVANIIGKNFLQFQKRFQSFTQTFSDFETILTDDLATDVIKRLDDLKENIGNFTRNDYSLLSQVLNYSDTFNETLMSGLLNIESLISSLINDWTICLKNTTIQMIATHNGSLTNQTMKHIKDFTSNIMLRSTLSFNDFTTNMATTFYNKLAELKQLMKGTYLNNSILIFNDFTTSVKSIAKGTDSLLNLDSLFSDFKANALNELSSAIDDALSEVFNLSAVYLDSLETQCQSFFNGLNAKLWQDLLNNQDDLDVAYNMYSAISWNRSDYTTFRNNQAMNFTTNYFDFLQNSTDSFDEILANVDLSKLLQQTSNNITNVTNFNILYFQLDAVSQLSAISRLYINNLVDDFNSSTMKISIDNKAKYLNSLMINQFNALLEPTKDFFFSDDAFLNYKISLNLTVNDLLNVINGELLDINSYINALFNSTGESSLHIVVMLGYFRKLKLDPIPTAFQLNIDAVMQQVSNQYTTSFSMIKSIFLNNLANITMNNLSNISLENSIFNKTIKDFIYNKVSDPIFSTLLNQELTNITNVLIIPAEIKQNLQTNLNTILTNVNSLFDTLLALLQAKLQDLVNQIDGQDQIYQQMIVNFEKLQDFTFKTFNLSEIIYNNVNAFQKAFESQVDNIVNGVIGFLDPLNKDMDNLLGNFEKTIEFNQIQKIIDQNVLGPIQAIRQGIMQTCQSMLDSLTDQIIDMANNLLGDNSDSNSLRVLQTVDINELQDVINFFNSIVSNSVNFVTTLPLIGDVLNTYNNFKILFDGSLVKIIQNLGQTLYGYVQKADEKVIDYLKQSLSNKVSNINNFVQNQLSSVNGLVSDCTNVIRSFSWDSLSKDLLALVYKERDKLINFLLSKIAKLSFSDGNQYGHSINYDIVLPIGPVPLTFGFSFDWNVFYSIGFGVQGLGIFIDLKAGASSDVMADAGVGLPVLKVVGYIKGTIAKGEADFSINYVLVTLKADLQLCFSVSFGETKVGVQVQAYLPISKYICWVQNVVQNICNAIFLGWLCHDIFKVINICGWVTDMEWGLYIDFFPPITLFSPHTIQICPWQKQLG